MARTRRVEIARDSMKHAVETRGEAPHQVKPAPRLRSMLSPVSSSPRSLSKPRSEAVAPCGDTELPLRSSSVAIRYASPHSSFIRSNCPSIHDARPTVSSARTRPLSGRRGPARRKEGCGALPRGDVLAAELPVHPQVAAQPHARLSTSSHRARLRPAASRAPPAGSPSSAIPRSTRCELRRSPRCRRGSRGRPPHSGGVAPGDLVRFAGCLELLAGVVRDRLQHPERSPSTWTSALSTSDSSSSRQPLPLRRSPRRSASVQPPEKTAMRLNSRCSASLRSEWLQSIAARSVCCRSGAVARTGRQQVERMVEPFEQRLGDKSRSRAAASSSASGSPSRRRQSASTTGALSSVNSNDAPVPR